MYTQYKASVYEIADYSVFFAHFKNHRGSNNINEHPPRKANNIAKYQNSKIGNSLHESTYILAKTINESAWFIDGNKTLQLQESTELFGALTLQLSMNKNIDLISSNPI